MSHAETPNYPPIESSTSTVAWLEAASGFWTDVHNEAQQVLTELEQDVRRKLVDVRVTSGRTSGKAFLLFTYKTFSTSDHQLDPVVVGITFSPVGDQVQVQADISGEQTGDLIVSLPTVTIAKSREHTIEAARKLANGLKQSVVAVVEALRDETRRTD